MAFQLLALALRAADHPQFDLFEAAAHEPGDRHREPFALERRADEEQHECVLVDTRLLTLAYPCGRIVAEVVQVDAVRHDFDAF